ncbi:hypothetical protein NP233_g8135 [Leucocoprinus birnbaumii]|uniref:Asl1-like glycosyl hydrolase catalytic domain-containing protein n=1 Tax=Leucocoprinus birnbaumii TaxID=56174 RepID=A0AAD5VTD3_9AGAR|nr:hypothetical protein NP233_g8135 [Leucocoprinus birnbaumii]
MECCPMLWGSKQISDFTKLVKPGYAKCAMGPNEPNQSGQSDMSPSDAANLWQKYLQPLKKDGYYLVSPACTNAPSGITWMQSFLGDCKGCDVDALGLHWYGTEYEDFISYVTKFHNTFNKDIWVTEFACMNFAYPVSDSAHQCNIDKVFTFMQKVTAWMDSTSYVKAYFAFGALTDMGNVNPTNKLMTGGQTPNALGKLYIGV